MVAWERQREGALTLLREAVAAVLPAAALHRVQRALGGARRQALDVGLGRGTARLTQLHAELFALMGFPVVEIHSRKSQSHRTKTSEMFRNQSRKIMFSSDVSARARWQSP